MRKKDMKCFVEYSAAEKPKRDTEIKHKAPRLSRTY